MSMESVAVFLTAGLGAGLGGDLVLVDASAADAGGITFSVTSASLL
jgi:hypothetical protein